ncbi:glycoside hydrolase domain-containing protein [uncultured Piscinibacter sp.]|uniref:glycoside hydrolase domain-containing protein n=1 Tax=uncultured Piscinibacter sp. TaxID=1131835 RepID=UPI00263343D1|nr:glycoside hydrolase domain-containing protein [uncultured Piscinibacter sp.]
MRKGFSTSRRCEDKAACLQSSEVDFVIRYHSARTTNPGKRISPPEAAALARAGLRLVTVYQDRARELQDFGKARGREDGLAAFTFAAQVGQPPGSAIYFAVDTDLSNAQIDAVVLPYFRGVRAALTDAASAGIPYRVGVYGSGLVCQRVKENEALAEFSWLAMSTGWRGSDVYASWDLKQSSAIGDLCGLGPNDREAVQSKADFDAFGAFTPVGAEVVAGSGEPRRVTASELNLRHVPSTVGNTPIARLREGQMVRVLGPALEPFVRVRVALDGGDVIGYVSGRFLAPVSEAIAETAATTQPARAPGRYPAVHYREGDARSQRASAARRAQPLGEPGQPRRDPTADAATRTAQLDAIVQWLDVEHSQRYARTPDATFCNIYAADFAYLARAYLPRVWWKSKALHRLDAGETLEALYDVTVREMRADDLMAWLIEFGADFGWRRVFDATALQGAANAGSFAVICADRATERLPGHIAVVVPETPALAARRDADGNVVMPVQSQAGGTNRARFLPVSAWWDDVVTYRDRGFFVHEVTPP